MIGSSNYESEVQRENARLKRELRDTQDALDVLKKAIGILGNLQKKEIPAIQSKGKKNGIYLRKNI